MTDENRVNESFEALLEGLKALRPSQEEDGKTIFSYYHGKEKERDGHPHPVVLQAGEMEGIHWVDISIGLIQLRADRAEWATALQQANRDICVGKAVPRWLALDELVGVAFVHRMDWQHVSARVLDLYIVDVLEEVHNFGSVGEDKKKEAVADKWVGEGDIMPAGALNRSFGELLEDMRSLWPLSNPLNAIGDDFEENLSDSFEYEGGSAELREGCEAGVHWVDIIIRLHGFTIDRLDWAKYILEANSEMCQGTPIPTWFALDDRKRLLFINRLDWRYLEAQVLKEHIQRCIEQMVPAVTASGVGLVDSGRHGPSDEGENDHRRDLY